MSKRGDPKIIIHNPEAREKILAGAKELYESVASVYGPTSGNVAIQKNYGDSTITHDGVTVSRDVFIKDGAMDIGAEFLDRASKKTNDISGDGTSATIMLGYHIIEKANQRIAAGFNPLGLRRGIDKASLWIKEQLDKQAVPVKDLTEVATISASDPELGKLVADTV